MLKDQREAEWNERKARNSIEEELKNSFSLNIGNNADKFLDILSGKYKTPPIPGEPARISRKDNLNIKKVASKNLEDIEEFQQEGEVESAIDNYANTVSNNKFNKYAEFIDELERFPIKTPDIKSKVIEGIRVALNDVIIKEVAKNTKNAYKSYVKEVYKVKGGIKVAFLFNNQNILVTAKGNFFGDEVICVHKKGENVVPIVIKINNEGFTDLSSNFEISLENK